MKNIKITDNVDIPEESVAFFQSHQAHGSPPKDENESKRLGERIRAIQKQCWFNARRAVMKLKDFAEASYVEGWAVLDSGLCIEHGWLVKDGVLLDPTLPTRVHAYFPGLEFRGRAEIKSFFATPQGKKCKGSPFFYAYGWGGCLSPTMLKAQTDAMEYFKANLHDGVFVPPNAANRSCNFPVPTEPVASDLSLQTKPSLPHPVAEKRIERDPAPCSTSSPVSECASMYHI